MVHASNFVSNFVLQILVLLIFWWIAAAVTTIEIKSLLSPGEDVSYPYPFALTGFTNLLCGACAWAALGVQGVHTKSVTWFSRKGLLVATTLGILQGCEYGLLNLALHDLTLSLRQMIMATSAVYTFVTAQFYGLPPAFNFKRLGCMILLGLGGFAQGWAAHIAEEKQINLTRGLIVIVIALTISSQRWALAQLTFQHESSPCKDYSKIEMSARMLPAAAVPCFIMSAATEAPPTIDGPVLGKMLIAVVGILVITTTELKLIHMTSSTTGVVFTLLHNIPLILCGVIFFHDKIEGGQIAGFLLTLLGSFFYALCTDISTTLEPIEESQLLPENELEQGVIGMELPDATTGTKGEKDSACEFSTNNVRERCFDERSHGSNNSLM